MSWYQPNIKRSLVNELSLLLGRKKTRTPIKESIFGGIKISDAIRKAEAMNYWFASIGEILVS